MSIECKDLSQNIRNFNESKWKQVAGNLCHPGIRAKFEQNPLVLDTLICKTGHKRIVECASDHLWGMGLSLGNPECLNSSKWISQGILGQILEDIRNKFQQLDRLQYQQNPLSSANMFHSSRDGAACATTNMPNVTYPTGSLLACQYPDIQANDHVSND